MSMSSGTTVGYWQLVRENSRFRRLWSAQLISAAGDWFNSVTVLGLVWQLWFAVGRHYRSGAAANLRGGGCANARRAGWGERWIASVPARSLWLCCLDWCGSSDDSNQGGCAQRLPGRIYIGVAGVRQISLVVAIGIHDKDVPIPVES